MEKYEKPVVMSMADVSDVYGEGNILVVAGNAIIALVIAVAAAAALVTVAISESVVLYTEEC